MLQLDDGPTQPTFPKAKGSVPELMDRLTTAWLDAQVASYEIKDDDERSSVIGIRLDNAEIWFKHHDVSDPQYGQASVLQRELEVELKKLQTMYRSLLMRCWTACTSAYVLLWSLPEAQRQAWLAQHFPENYIVALEEAGHHPIELWKFLMGERPAPGNWPHEERDLWVGRANQVEYWNQEMLQARLKKWESKL